MIPTFPNFVDGGLTHATPFDHTQQVPLLLYGPGFVSPGVYDEPATLTDLSQTAASLLRLRRLHGARRAVARRRAAAR